MRVPKRTEFASKALDLAARFRLQVGAQALSGPNPYRVELSAPEGISTGGGAQSVQHIKLQPADGSFTIVLGSADQKEGFAELRTYDCVKELHQQRFKGVHFPLESHLYQPILQSMDRFFRSQGMRVVMLVAELTPRPSVQLPAAARSPVLQLLRSPKVVGFAGAVVGLVLGIVGYLLFRAR